MLIARVQNYSKIRRQKKKLNFWREILICRMWEHVFGEARIGSGKTKMDKGPVQLLGMEQEVPSWLLFMLID